MNKRIKVNMAKCLLCGDIIVSEHRHDHQACSCGMLKVDGGKEYIRRGFRNEKDYEEMSIYAITA